jgi:hypothetical protein
MNIENFALIVLISVLLVICTTFIFYEFLRFIWDYSPKLKVAPRKRIIFIILAMFFAHTLCIWIYATAYYLIIEKLGMGGFTDHLQVDFLSYVYFSAESYTSLGVNDLIPKDAFRFIAGVEALNGLLFIGWSVTFTYLMMERFWGMHERKRKS